jgi:hypothetical protein
MTGKTILFAFGFGGLALAGCAGDGNDAADGALTVSGTVVDFETGDLVEGSVTISTRGLEPPPTVTIDGSWYELAAVTPHSVFHVLAGAPPTHRATYGAAIEVTDSDLTAVEIAAVSETYLAELDEAFAVSPSAGAGVLLAQALDEGGDPVAGIPATAFTPPENALGPFFLDADLAPDPAATETSASGWVVFFEVEPGVVGLLAEPDSGVTIEMPLSPVAPAAATIATLRVTDGGVELPTGVSFANDVVPIFEQRGCQNCHSGSGPGRDLGNLTLDGSANLIHRELVEEEAGRVNLEIPEESQVLTMPSAEDPPDGHPNITFTGPLDPDYLTLLVWIREGALQN